MIVIKAIVFLDSYQVLDRIVMAQVNSISLIIIP